MINASTKATPRFNTHFKQFVLFSVLAVLAAVLAFAIPGTSDTVRSI